MGGRPAGGVRNWQRVPGGAARIVSPALSQQKSEDVARKRLGAKKQVGSYKFSAKRKHLAQQRPKKPVARGTAAWYTRQHRKAQTTQFKMAAQAWENERPRFKKFYSKPSCKAGVKRLVKSEFGSKKIHWSADKWYYDDQSFCAGTAARAAVVLPGKDEALRLLGPHSIVRYHVSSGKAPNYVVFRKTRTDRAKLWPKSSNPYFAVPGSQVFRVDGE